MPVSDVQLALQGGGAKIAYLIAALEGLQELEANNDVRVSRIVGTSAGAIAGCLFACGVKMKGVGAFFAEADLKAHFGLNWPSAITRLLKGYPIWKDSALAALLTRACPSIPFESLTFNNVQERYKRTLSVVSASLETGHAIEHTGEESVLNALLASCGLPFFFRSAKHPGASLVDGGLLENLPVEMLASEVAGGPPILAIGFDRIDPKPASGVLTYAEQLYDLVISNSSLRGRKKAGAGFYGIEPKFGTYDFQAAQEFFAKREYAETKDGFKQHVGTVLGRAKEETAPPTYHDLREANILLGATLAKIYASEHADRKLQYTRCRLVVIIRPDGKDQVSGFMQFNTLAEALVLHQVGFTQSQSGRLLERLVVEFASVEPNLRAPTKHIISVVGKQPFTKMALLSFNPAIPPNTGPHSIYFSQLHDSFLNELVPKGRDKLYFTFARTLQPVPVGEIILHYPQGMALDEPRALREDNWESPGRAMTKYELSHYPSVPGFTSIGWIGNNLSPGRKFGFDVELKSSSAKRHTTYGDDA